MLPPMPDPLKHGRMPQHARNDNVQNLPSSKVKLVDLTLLASGGEDDGVLDVEVHHVLSLEEEAADELTIFGFDGDDGSFGVV